MTDKPTTPPPAYFLSLSLENVRSFGEKQTISFAREDGRPAQWTIILGDNGVGKTTVLKALAAMRRNSKVNESGRIATSWQYIDAIWIPFRQNGGEEAVLRSTSITGNTLINLNHSQYVKYEFILLIKPSNRPYNSYRISRSNSVVRSGLSASATRDNRESLNRELIVYGYGAGRTTGNSVIGENPDNDDTCNSLFDDRADLLNPEEWFLNIDYGSKLAGENAGQLNKARALVEEMLKTVLPGVTELRIASTGTPQKPQISLQFLLFGTWVRLRDMSLGYQTLVVWLTDFASKLFIRYPDSPNPLEEPAIVLIDEIDLHLHPEWQRKLLGFLSGIFKNTQFIATAHSPLVVQAAGDEGANVVLLKREGDQTIVHQNVEDVRGWRLDQILTSELFGLETARSLRTEEKMQRRAELLIKTQRTAAEKKELETLTKALNAEPLGETPSEREVNAVLQELRQRMQQKGSDAAAV